MTGPKPNRRLGRGLNALLGGFSGDPKSDEDATAAPPKKADTPAEPTESQFVSVKSIKRNPFQPRSDFDETSLNELAESIRIHGVLQPILIRKVGDSFQLIAGERRLLASKRVGLTEIPCRVLELEDQQVSEAALEENLKRKDLNVLEKAQAFKDYVDRWGCTIGELGERLSMDRSSISNSLRLLDLPEKAKSLLLEDKITAGHAKAILPLEQEHQEAICERILAETLSVRKTEQAVRQILRGDAPDIIKMPTKPAAKLEPTQHVKALEGQFRDLLGLKVQIKLKKSDAGQVSIEFNSNDDFDKITRFLRKAG
jgi:ParB family transcriptional regulator, chromosome partitioning protein